MHHEFALIATLAWGLGLALILGFAATKVKLPALVGYLLAGVCIAPTTPGFVGDMDLASELSEVGVMLLMFGVGLHFSLSDLLRVKTVALPGAIIQMAIATAIGMGMAHWWGWNWGEAFILGLSLSCASTVVLMKGLEAKGWLADVTDMDRLRADINVDMRTYQLGFVPAMLSPDLEKTVRVPDNIHLSGNVTAKGSTYGAQLAMKEGSGEVRLKGSLDTKRMAYDVDLSANALQIAHFLPGQELQPFTGDLKAKGVGTDIFSPRTRLKAQASIRKFGMGTYNLGGVQGDVDMANGKMALHVDGDNDLMRGALALQGFTDNRKQLQATMEANIGKIDLYNLKLTKEPMALALCGHIDVATNYKDYYMVRGLLSDLGIYYEDNRYHPEAFELDLLTRKDTTHVAMNSGDFKVPASWPERLARRQPRPACGGSHRRLFSPLASSW